MHRGALAGWIADPQPSSPAPHAGRVRHRRRNAARAGGLAGAVLKCNGATTNCCRARRRAGAAGSGLAHAARLALLLTRVNNTNIGLLYIGTALLFFLLAGVLGLLMRAAAGGAGQHAAVGAGLQPGLHHARHGDDVPVRDPGGRGAGVYLLPNMLGARDLPFPRLSAYAYWAYAIGGLAFFCTLFVGLAPDGGWFMYPPLTGKAVFAGPERRLLAAGDRLHRDLGDRRRHRTDRRHPVHARARHDAGAHAGVRLGDAGGGA
jgi:hypothetical protein